MQFSPFWRKAALSAHVTSSVGWFGAVVAFMALAIVGVLTPSDQLMRGAYVAMEAIGWFVIIPFSAATLTTGLIQSAGTKWGFVRHYWVLSKLLITIGASLLLLVHMQVMSTVAAAASAGSLESTHLLDPRMQLVGDSVAAAVVLLIASGLSVFKPEGRTPFGSPEAGVVAVATTRTPMTIAFWMGVIALLVALVVRHLSGGIPHH